MIFDEWRKGMEFHNPKVDVKGNSVGTPLSIYMLFVVANMALSAFGVIELNLLHYILMTPALLIIAYYSLRTFWRMMGSVMEYDKANPHLVGKDRMIYKNELDDDDL